MGIQEYVISKGYKAFRYIDGKYIPSEESGITSYSTMSIGGLEIRYLKNGDESTEIMYGLREYGKPPTLIFPRPKITVMNKDGSIENEDYDDSMNICLRKESSEDIFKAMFDKTITFTYDFYNK